MSTTTNERIRYATTGDPVSTDGRDVSIAIGSLEGEAAQQQIKGEDRRLTSITPAAWEHVPQIGGPETTYYDRPMLKKSVWSIDIPIYYFLGGTAGAALTLGAAIQLVSPRGKHPMRRVSAICHWTGIIGSTAGAGFLIHDLGRPSRFLYMMRVFRPTSPMNIGAWILAGAAPSAVTTGLLINRHGFLGRIGEISGYVSGLFGAALAGYTGVLVANSAIPVWQEARRCLPVMFLGSSASAAASVIEIISDEKRARTMTAVFGAAGRIAEIAAAKQAERAVSAMPKVREPFEKGSTAILWKAATVLTGASLAMSLWPVRKRATRVVGGLMGIAGSICLRFAVHYISNASARDPRASFQHQRNPNTVRQQTHA